MVPPERPRFIQRARRPPQSNCPAAAVPIPDHGTRLESDSTKGGISPLAPQPSQGLLQSLPPILRIVEPNPTTAYSKAPRGLFVLPRVGRIFTASSISPSPSLRQRSSRYAIRAGRNLPDKEFRYLRTVHCCYDYRCFQTAVAARTFLPRSACRHADRTISSPSFESVWRMVSEDSRISSEYRHPSSGAFRHRSSPVECGGLQPHLLV